MRQDVSELRRYYQSPLGVSSARMIERRMAGAWPSLKDCDVLGLGYTAPFLDRYRAEARRVICAAPAAQGTLRWPGEGRALSTLVEETALPFREAVFDRILLVHLLEEADALLALLDAIHTALAPEGRLMVVATNRSGMWSRSEATPFGHGRSFSRAQLTRLLHQSRFTAVGWSRAVYMPPSATLGVPVGDAWERVGEVLWPGFGGVLMVEAIKREIAARPRSGLGAAVIGPFTQPVPGRAANRLQDG